jgi:Zn-dependent protease with chaperone function
MDPVRYNAIVARLEELARANPRGLRRRVVGLVALGYGYVLGVLLLVLASIVALVLTVGATHSGAAAVKVLIGLLALAWLIVKSLWVRAEPPSGHVLPAGAAPVLDQRVEQIRAALDAPHADTVLLTSDFNASVTQIPRFGIFGWPRTYLTLGIPLLYALDPHQLDAVLAHEFAHLSGAHPKLGLWVYRMSRTWRLLLANLAHRPAGRFVFSRFFRWYVPRLQAYGFVMSRRDEYEADAEAASLCGADVMGEALVALEIRSRALRERAWPEVWRRAVHENTPPERSWSTVAMVIRQELPHAERVEWLGRALRRHALDDDTHPSLGDRLRALGVAEPAMAMPGELAERLLPPLLSSAAGHYLGSVADVMLVTMDRQWHEEIAESWQQRHDELKVLRARADALLRRDGEDHPLEPGELWELTCAIAELDGDRAAIPYVQRAVHVLSSVAATHFMLGRALLAEGDSAGVRHVRDAMMLDSELLAPGLEMLRQHYAEVSDPAEVESIQLEQHAHLECLREVGDERGQVLKRDPFVPAELSAALLDALTAAASARPRVKAVWVARKLTRLMPDRPLLVVLVEPHWWRWRGPSAAGQRLAQEMLEAIAPSTTGDLLVITLHGHIRWLREKMKRVAGARVLSIAMALLLSGLSAISR